MPPWHRCRVCGWWQTSLGACAGCFQTSKSIPKARQQPRTGISNHEPPSQELLHRRWQEAKNSASQPHHVKIERLCQHCLLRTLNSKPDCRGCGRSLQDCARILPGQWPPLGCTAAMLRNFEEPPAAAQQAAEATCKAPDKPEPMEQELPAPDRPLLNVPLAALLPGTARPNRGQPHGRQKGNASQETRGGHPRPGHRQATANEQSSHGRRSTCPRPKGESPAGRGRTTTGGRAGELGHPGSTKGSLPDLRAREWLRDSHAHPNHCTLHCPGWTLPVSADHRPGLPTNGPGCDTTRSCCPSHSSATRSGEWCFPSAAEHGSASQPDYCTALGGTPRESCCSDTGTDLETPGCAGYAATGTRAPDPSGIAVAGQPTCTTGRRCTSPGSETGPISCTQTQVAWTHGRSRQGIHILLAFAFRQECVAHAGSWRSEPGPGNTKDECRGSLPHTASSRSDAIQSAGSGAALLTRRPRQRHLPAMFVHKARGITWLHLVQLVAIAGCMDGGQTWGLFSVFLPFRPLCFSNGVCQTLRHLWPPVFPHNRETPCVRHRERERGTRCAISTLRLSSAQPDGGIHLGRLTRPLSSECRYVQPQSCATGRTMLVHPQGTSATGSPWWAQRPSRQNRAIHPARGMRIGEATHPGPSASQPTTGNETSDTATLPDTVPADRAPGANLSSNMPRSTFTW